MGGRLVPARVLHPLAAGQIERMHRPAPARLALLLSVALIVVACGEPVATPEPIYLSATGATEMAPLVAELAAAFGEEQPTVHLEVSGPGTQYGLNTLYAGETNLALASWLPLDPSTPSGRALSSHYRATAIGRDGIAIIVHPDNPVEGIGLLQLQDLFGGRVHDWQAVTPLAAMGQILVVSREDGAGTRAAFESLVMQDQRITPRAIVQSSPQATVDYVADHPGALGYVSMGSVSTAVKVLKIEGDLPSPEGVARGSYVLSRELWLVTADPPPQGVKLFLDFALSPAGQEIVSRQFGRIR
jgi:phosphate transport system substrate-binding protein